MKNTLKLTLSLLLLLALFVSPLAALAQDGGDLEVFEAEDGSFSVAMPEGWVAVMDLDQGGFVLANSQDLLDIVMSGDDEDYTPSAEEIAVLITALPTDMLFFFGVEEIDAENPSESLQAIAEALLGSEGAELGEIELIELEDGPVVGQISITDEEMVEQGGEGALYLINTEAALILATSVTGEGGFENFGEIVPQIVASLEFDTEVFFADMGMGDLDGGGEEAPAEEAPAPEATEEAGD